MGGRIECYLDLASFYSYVGFLDLFRNQELLASHGVEVDIKPLFLGGVNSATGNKPPTTLPAKALHSVFDSQRTLERVGNPPFSVPEDFFGHAHTVLPLRALHYVKRNYPRDVFQKTMLYFFDLYWSPPNVNLTKPPAVTKALSELQADYKGHGTSKNSKPLFTPSDVEAIVKGATSQEYKDALKSTTEEALERGAFGAPWLWVTNSAGEAEPFFGSDRFNYVYRFLGLPYQDVALLPPNNGAKPASKL